MGADQKNYLLRLWSAKRLLSWLFIVIICFITGILRFSLDENNYLLQIKILDIVFGSFLTLALFNFIYQVYTERENRDIAIKDIINAIQLEEDSLKYFSTNQKLLFLKNIVNSIIGEQFGTLFHNHIATHYLESNIAYRENFDYEVTLNEANKDFSFKGERLLSAINYFAMTQQLVYTKHFSKKTKDVRFKIVFAFNDESLAYWMNEEFVFFREVIDIDDWENDLNNYAQEDFKDFVEKCMGIDITFFDKSNSKIDTPLNYDIRFINNNKAKGLEIELSDKNLFKSLIYEEKYTICYRCRLLFKMPWNKKRKRFHFILPEPTINPSFTMRFDHHKFKQSDINHHTIFSNTTKKPDLVIYDNNYSLKTYDIIYPRSEVIFFWDAC